MMNLYKAALDWMDTGASLAKCAELVVDALSSVGITYYSCTKSVLEINRQYREVELFPARSITTKSTIMLFSHFPEAREMLILWSKDNIASLNCETAREYVLNHIIPECRRRCNEEFCDQSLPPLTESEFLEFVGLTRICASTAWRWLRLLGFKYESMNKSFYTDRHEDKDNIKYRMKFIEEYFRHEMRTYHWVVIKDNEAERLENLQKDPLQKKSYRKRYPIISDDGDETWYREYHVDVHPLLLDFVDDNNKKKHGGNLSIDFPKGQRPLIMVGQDESVFYQNCFSSRGWTMPDSQKRLNPKSQGHAVMISGFVLDQFSFRYYLSEQQLEEINEARRHQNYMSTEAAKKIYDDEKKNVRKGKFRSTNKQIPLHAIDPDWQQS